MSIFACHNPAMRWPWSDIGDELRLIHEALENLRDSTREDTASLREAVAEMHRRSDEREREVNRRLEELRDESRTYRARTQIEHEEMIAELRAGREALFRMLDRLPPATGEA